VQFCPLSETRTSPPPPPPPSPDQSLTQTPRAAVRNDNKYNIHTAERRKHATRTSEREVTRFSVGTTRYPSQLDKFSARFERASEDGKKARSSSRSLIALYAIEAATSPSRFVAIPIRGFRFLDERTIRRRSVDRSRISLSSGIETTIGRNARDLKVQRPKRERRRRVMTDTERLELKFRRKG